MEDYVEKRFRSLVWSFARLPLLLDSRSTLIPHSGQCAREDFRITFSTLVFSSRIATHRSFTHMF